MHELKTCLVKQVYIGYNFIPHEEFANRLLGRAGRAERAAGQDMSKYAGRGGAGWAK